MKFLYQRVSDSFNRKPLTEEENSLGIKKFKEDGIHDSKFQVKIESMEELKNMMDLYEIWLYDGYFECGGL